MDDESDRAGVTVTEPEALAKLRADLRTLIAEAEAEPSSPERDEWMAGVKAQLALVPDEPGPLTPQQEANREDWLRRAATANDRCKRWEGSEEQKANHAVLEAAGIRLVRWSEVEAQEARRSRQAAAELAVRRVLPRPVTLQRGDDVVRRSRPRVDGSSRLTHGPPERGDDDPHPCERRRRSAERGSL